MHYPKIDESQVPSAPMQMHLFPPEPPPQVAIGAPPMQFQAPGAWTTGLCGCFDDADSCCLTLWCPCITFGRIAHMTDRGMTSRCGSASLYCFLLLCVGFQWIYSCAYRRNLRMLYNLPETPCCDCCVEYCCECCSLCQMYRELQKRGVDMSLGYHENMQRLGQIPMQPPYVPGAMIR